MDNGGVITNLKTKENWALESAVAAEGICSESGEYFYSTCKPDGSRQCRYYVTYSGGVFRYQKCNGSGSDQ